MAALLAEIGAEIAASPARFIAEVVQFGILIGIGWVVAVGSAKRPGMVVRAVSRRRERIASEMERVASADAEVVAAIARSEDIERASKAEVRSVVREARTAARAQEKAAQIAADAEASRLRSHAGEVLESERADIQQALRGLLVDLVAQATRSILNEGLTAAEQRELIQTAVSESVARIEGSMEPAPHKKHGAAL